MNIEITKENLIRPLLTVSSVIERSQTLPIMGNILVRAKDGVLTLIGSDIESEMNARIPCDGIYEEGEITVPGRKFTDIVKSLSNDVLIRIKHDSTKNKLQVSAGRSRFTLSTLPARDFPYVEMDESKMPVITLPAKDLLRLINSSSYAMGQNDVRSYLNGMLFHLKANELRTVATDGHRLATCASNISHAAEETQVIIPRKGIGEISKMLQNHAGADENITLVIGQYHMRLHTEHLSFTVKRIDHKFPDYSRVIPSGEKIFVTVDRKDFRDLLVRVAILSSEKFNAAAITFQGNELRAVSNNAEQEEADELLAADIQGDSSVKDEGLRIGFNVKYLIDALNSMTSEKVVMKASDSNSSMVILGDQEPDLLSIAMPMRL